MTEYTYELEQDGVTVAIASGEDHERVKREIMHYAMVYGQDGPVKIHGPHIVSDFSELKPPPDSLPSNME